MRHKDVASPGVFVTYCVLSMRGFKIMSRVLSCRVTGRECVRGRFALWSRDSREGRAYRRASEPLSPTNMLLLLACLCVSQQLIAKLPITSRLTPRLYVVTVFAQQSATAVQELHYFFNVCTSSDYTVAYCGVTIPFSKKL